MPTGLKRPVYLQSTWLRSTEVRARGTGRAGQGRRLPWRCPRVAATAAAPLGPPAHSIPRLAPPHPRSPHPQAWQYPLRYGYVPELIEMMTLCKYDARPHFGKNWARTFTYPRCPVRSKYPQFEDLLKLQAKVDPDKVRTRAAV
jgi:hypothetical protein